MDDDGSAITAYGETGEMELGTGDELMFIDRIIPDAEVTGSLTFTLKTRKYPNGTETTKSPAAATSSTTKLNTRARGRQLAIRAASSAISDDWRLGTIRLRMWPDGAR